MCGNPAAAGSNYAGALCAFMQDAALAAEILVYGISGG
jgi:hypothetical protein